MSSSAIASAKDRVESRNKFYGNGRTHASTPMSLHQEKWGRKSAKRGRGGTKRREREGRGKTKGNNKMKFGKRTGKGPMTKPRTS